MVMRVLRKYKVAAKWGATFGMAAPFIALPIGLNYSPDLANVLIFAMMPIMLLSGQYLGELSFLWRILGYLFSVVFWSLAFVAVAIIYAALRQQDDTPTD